MRQYFSLYAKPRTPEPVTFRDLPRVRVATSVYLSYVLHAAWREDLPDRIHGIMADRGLPLGGVAIYIRGARAEVHRLDDLRDDLRHAEIPGLAALREIPPAGALWVVADEVAPAYVDADVELPNEAELLPLNHKEPRAPRRRRRRKRSKSDRSKQHKAQHGGGR